MYGTGKPRGEQSSQEISQKEYGGAKEDAAPQQQQQSRQLKTEYLPTDRSSYEVDSVPVDRSKQPLRTQLNPEYLGNSTAESSTERARPQLRSPLNTDYSSSNATPDRPVNDMDSVSSDRTKLTIRPQLNTELLTNTGPVERSTYDAASPDQSSIYRAQQQPLRSQPVTDYPSSSGNTDRSLYESRQNTYTAYNAAPPKERTIPHSKPSTSTTSSTLNTNPSHTPKLLSKPNAEYVRPPQNFVLPPQMRPAVGPPQPRPPFAGARPMVGMGPRPPMPPPNMAVRQMAPPPLRTTDSKSNLLMGPPPPGMRPGMPPPQLSQQSMQQARLPNSGGPLSPPGQGPPRPPGGFPWNPAAGAPGMPPGARPPPPQNMTRPPPPTFPRPLPGQPLQAPFRPPFNQPPMQPQQQQQPQQLQQHMQQQQQQQQHQPPQQLRPLSAASAHNNNDDDDDVVMGPAVTPLKTFNPRADPMGSPLLEETEPPFETSPPAVEARKGPGFKGDNDSGVDESTQEKDRNGPNSPSSPVKTPTSTSSKPGTSRPPSATPSNKSAPKSRSASKNRLLLKTPEPEPVKKVPMNKVQVGHAPSPNLKAVRSKIGSLDNATYKPGGGHVKIESKKIEIKAAPRIEAKNDKYAPKGGEKKIVTTKLQWNAKSKIGSLENAAHKPGGGDKKIETLKMDFNNKAKSKVNSKDNVKHQPGGGDIKIQTQKIEIKAQSKVGSLDNVKHKPGGGEKKIFDDKDYLKNVEHSVALTTPPTQSPLPSMTASGADENLNQQS
ncbi:hypothetical protein KR038_010659 [Drosophila bunnanda]|nr:hypothetical protein KR038_010659 [Drosophila bunnanda]